MHDFFKNLQREVNRKVDKIERSEQATHKKAMEAVRVLGDAVERLKKFTVEHDFKDEAEEIDFFKDKKPRICSLLIYYRKLYNIEMNRPIASIEAQRLYLNGQLDAINQYTVKRLDFIRYYRGSFTYLDQNYFLRNQNDTEQYLESFQHERDPMFSTLGDFKVANILANDMLVAYLMTELEKLDSDNRKIYGYPPHEARLTWQGSKTDLL